MSTDFTWSDRGVRAALGLSTDTARPGLEFGGISTDTRTLRPGDLFVALEGERFDGHAFVAAAEAAGAAGAVVRNDPPEATTIPLYRVADTLIGLGDLARHRRRALPARVVAITGSSGKTTVKELLAAALGVSFRVHATRGNLNNRVGVPLSLLAAPADAEVLVIELGTSEPGEIGILTDIVEPDHGLLTTVGEAHLSGLGSFEGVMQEKLDLLRGVSADGVALVGDTPAELLEAAREIRADVHVAGLSERADPDARGALVGQEPDGRHRLRFRGREVTAGIPGRHGAWNLVLALAMASMIGADLPAAAESAAGVGAGRLRGEVRSVGGLTLLLDCYNANPQSVEAALELLAGLPGPGAKVAMLGSMLELGERSDELHSSVLRAALELPLDRVVATGEFARAATDLGDAAATPRLIVAETVDAAYDALRDRLPATSRILLKASRGVAMEALVERFESDFGGGGEDRSAGGPVGETGGVA